MGCSPHCEKAATLLPFPKFKKPERIYKMKQKILRACLLGTAAGGLLLVSGCVIEPGRVAFQPVVVEAEPPEPVLVPDSYAWDGVEYVGLVGDQYFYLGPGNVWLVADPFRLERFHGWERGHPDWREHAIRNDHFRADRDGHVQPRRDARARPAPERKREDQHDQH